MTSYIGWENLLEAAGATVTVTNAVGVTDAQAETPAGNHTNAFNWNTFDFWIPAAAGSFGIKVDLGSGNDAQPDYLAIAAHNFHEDGLTGSKLILRSSDIGNATSVTGNPATGWVSEWSSATGPSEPTAARPHLWNFQTTDNDTRRYWLISCFTTDLALRLGALSFGRILQLPQIPEVGFAPIHWDQSETRFNSMSEGGAFLGRQVIRNGRRGQIRISNASRSWIDTNWANFDSHAQVKPFWYTYDYENQADETVFCWLDGRQRSPFYRSPTLFNATLSVRALY